MALPIAEPASISFTLDGEAIEALPGETLLQASTRHGRQIPHLCHKDGLRPDGNCRACVVEIQGERVLAPSCCRQPTAGMVVDSASKRARRSQQLVLELLQSDIPASSYTRDSELERWAGQLGVSSSRFPARAQPAGDASHPAIAVNLDACIQCTRCLRACREEQVNDVIGFARRGAAAAIVFDLEDPLGASSCVGCGECVQACPTGALMPAGDVGEITPEKSVDSLCPYCGVGCQLSYQVRDNRILYVNSRDGPANGGRLCVKGRYGFDYVHNPQRLTVPLIRRDDAPKRAALELDPDDPFADFREATWEEARERAASGLKRIRDTQGPNSLAGFGSAKGSNEEAYLFQKLVRTGFGTNNVDHCTRLCHASSVAALLEMIGSGAVSTPVRDAAKAQVILIIGSNTTVNHPVAATFVKNEVRRGKTLIVLDPRRTPIAEHATHFLHFKPDTDVALLNALMQSVIEQDLVDRDFVARRTAGFEELRAHLEPYSPERMEPICGIEADVIREVARVYAAAPASIIFWGMGISQHVHGTDNARALISLALLCGQIGRPGTGLHPLRGQNNVQGASDVGLIPMVFPDYQRVDNEQARARQDLDIILDMAHRLGLDWDCAGPQGVFAEMRRAMPSIAGISWERLEREGSVTYPCPTEEDPGQPIIFIDDFPTADGKARFVPAPFTNADELPDEGFPWVLITGRLLEHWHTGAMTRRAAVLDQIEPEPVAMLHPDDLARIGVQAGERILLSSRRGEVTAFAGADSGLQPGQVFLPFCYHEAAANLLTNAALDPTAKIPEFKFCALRVARAGPAR